MRKVQGVSFPRSGHKLLVVYLSRYFSRSLDTCTQLPAHFYLNNFGYCEYYRHCRRRPCTDSKVNFQKYHDRRLDLRKDTETCYLVQYREPLPAIISHYKIQAEYFQRIPNSPDAWRKFFRENLEYYTGFLEKWVYGDGTEHILRMKYEDWTRDSLPYLKNAIRFFDPETAIDETWLGAVIASEKVQHHDYRSFIYYESSMEDEVSAILNRV